MEFLRIYKAEMPNHFFGQNFVIRAMVEYTLDRLLALSYNCSCTVVSCSIIHDIIASDGRRNDDLLIFNAQTADDSTIYPDILFLCQKCTFIQ